MAPRGSQRKTPQPFGHYSHLDPWLHEGANIASKFWGNLPDNLDPWLHEGANLCRRHIIKMMLDLDPWLHEGAN